MSGISSSLIHAHNMIKHTISVISNVISTDHDVAVTIGNANDRQVDMPSTIDTLASVIYRANNMIHLH